MCMWFGHLPQINFVIPNTDLKNGSCNFMVSYVSSSFYYFFFFCGRVVVTARQDYFTHFELSQS